MRSNHRPNSYHRLPSSKGLQTTAGLLIVLFLASGCVSGTRLLYQVPDLHPVPITEISVNGDVNGIAISDGAVWAIVLPGGLFGGPKVVKVDPNTNQVVGTIPISSARLPFSLEVCDGVIWVKTIGDPLLGVTRLSNGKIDNIDAKTGELIETITVDKFHRPCAIGKEDLWVTDFRDSTISPIDSESKEVVAIIPVGKTPVASAIGEGNVWVLNAGDGTISRIDAKTNHVVATLRVPALPGSAALRGFPKSLAIHKGIVWVTGANKYSDGLFLINPQTNQVFATIFSPKSGILDNTSLLHMAISDEAIWLGTGPRGTLWRINLKDIPVISARVP